MATNQTSTATVTLTSNGSVNDTIALACSGLPAGASCAFSSASVNLAPGAIAASQLTISTGATIAGLFGHSNRRPEQRTAALGELFLPIGVFFGCVFGRLGRKRRDLSTAALLLVLCGVALFAVGCASIHIQKEPGTYIIQVTGTGVKSNAVQSQDVTLNITQ
jgi:hypothetical protein